MTKQPDILIFMSDQHNAGWLGAAGHPFVRTPNLDRIAAHGTRFDAAYTPCPICVPARIAFLTGYRPSRTGAYHNSNAIAEEQATFLHGLGAAGYETVLCGRMHFRGVDTRHGFTRRIFPDLLPKHHGRREVMLENFQGLGEALADQAADFIGRGYSPVLDYDRHVTQAALDYLEEDHEKPQCLVVGTYGPHHPFIAEPELFDYYRGVADLPATFGAEVAYAYPRLERMPALVGERRVLAARAAYAGVIEHLDGCVGRLREAWEAFLGRRGRGGLFVYTSDHGEHAGEHGIYGKSTFLEPSVRIPMMMEGFGEVEVAAGQQVDRPVSLMDVGATACALGRAEVPPRFEGEDLGPLLRGERPAGERTVYAEICSVHDPAPGVMARRGRWKYVHYHGYDDQDLLFDLAEDPHERVNVLPQHAETADELRAGMASWWRPEAIRRRVLETNEHLVLLGKWGRAVQAEEDEIWRIPSFRFRRDETGYLYLEKTE